MVLVWQQQQQQAPAPVNNQELSPLFWLGMVIPCDQQRQRQEALVYMVICMHSPEEWYQR